MPRCEWMLALAFIMLFTAQARTAWAVPTGDASAPSALYVSPSGSDSSPGTRRRPFATLERARDALRPLIAAGLSKNVVIYLAGGSYALDRPFVLGPEDSGSQAHSITYAALPGQHPIVHGGQAITGWKPGAGRLWTAHVPISPDGQGVFRQLFVDGQRRQRARSPNTGFFYVNGPITLDHPASFQARAGDINPAWAAQGDVEVIALQSWAEIRMPIRAVHTSQEHLVPGKIGSALSLDGATSYLDVKDSPALEPAALTLAAWVKAPEMPTGGDPRRWIVSKGSNEWQSGHYSLVFDEGVPGCYLNIGGGADNTFDVWGAKGSMRPGEWTHLAMTYDGMTLRLYVDGKLAGSKHVGKPRAPGTGPLVFGRRPDAYSYSRIDIDDTRLYNRALTPAEIGEVHADGQAGKSLPGPAVNNLVAWWGFDGPGATDLTGHGHGAAGAGVTVTLAGTPPPSNRENNARYWIENALDALDEPGEWFLNRRTGTVYYWPLPGEHMDSTHVMAPRIDELVRLNGGPEATRLVQNVHFQGIDFRYSDWTLPETGYADLQAAYDIPAAFEATGAADCSLESCSFSRLGRYAVEFGRGCKDDRVDACNLFDLGAGGVKIGEPDVRTQAADMTGGCVVADCDIHDIGIVYPAAVGVWIGQSAGNIITHNHIYDTNYTGISVGWTWGYGPTNARANIIEYNLVDHISRDMLSDLGGVYCLGVQPGTIIRHNIFHDIVSYTYGGWGIYMDEGSSGILIADNIVYNTKSGGFHQHYGANNRLVNNILALATEAQIIRTRVEQHLSFTFEHNIVYFNSGWLLGGAWSGDQYRLDDNLYWDARGGVPQFAGMSFADWQRQGRDVHSLIADPLFTDPLHGNFKLKPGSPASKIGFQPIDTSQVGPRARPGA